MIAYRYFQSIPKLYARVSIRKYSFYYMYIVKIVIFVMQLGSFPWLLHYYRPWWTTIYSLQTRCANIEHNHVTLISMNVIN